MNSVCTLGLIEIPSNPWDRCLISSCSQQISCKPIIVWSGHQNTKQELSPSLYMCLVIVLLLPAPFKTGFLPDRLWIKEYRGNNRTSNLFCASNWQCQKKHKFVPNDFITKFFISSLVNSISSQQFCIICIDKVTFVLCFNPKQSLLQSTKSILSISINFQYHQIRNLINLFNWTVNNLSRTIYCITGNLSILFHR